MKKYICDLCKKEISPAEVIMGMEIDINGNKKTLDMHSDCFRRFMDKIKETEDERS